MSKNTRGVERSGTRLFREMELTQRLWGNHVAVKCPPGSGSIYYNYKKFYSIVLMALVDSQYRLLFVDVGAQGSISDGGVFSGTELYEALEGGYAGLPQPEPLPGDDKPIPFSLIADDAFALRTWMQKPFSFRGMNKNQRIFNYRTFPCSTSCRKCFWHSCKPFQMSPHCNMPQKEECGICCPDCLYTTQPDKLQKVWQDERGGRQ